MKKKMGDEYERILSSGSNQIRWNDRMLIQNFLAGRIRTNPYHAHQPKARIVLHETTRPISGTETDRLCMEYIIFEMDFVTGKWRKLRRTTQRLNEQCQDHMHASTGIWDANGNRSPENNFNSILEAPMR